MARSDKLNETHDRLVAAIEALTSGEEWQRMLDTARRFHHYSFGNLLLIAAQRPDATRVAGFHTWRQLGRSVRKGERGIAILAPLVYRNRPLGEREEQERPELARVLRGFRVVYVFDEAQSEGVTLDEVPPVLLEGDAPALLWDRVADQVAAAGFTLTRQDCAPANGTTNYTTRQVIVRPDVTMAQATKTLCHELAHVLLHQNVILDEGCRGLAEVEAESVAYLVCSAVGLATDDYTFPYVGVWAGGDVALVRSTAERVIATARGILDLTQLLTEPEPAPTG